MTTPYPPYPPYPPPPVVTPQKSSRRLLIAGGAFALIVLVGTVVAIRWNAIGQAIGPSCTIGVTGTAANVTVQGWTADAACQTMSGPNTYKLSSGPQGVIVCQYEIQGNLVTVRDEGLLKLVGAAACARLQQQNASTTQ